MFDYAIIDNMMVDASDEMLSQILDQYHSLVKHIANTACYSSASIDINDLYQVGDMAVLRAVKAYDPSSGKSIKSFVANSIRNAIFNEAAKFLGVFTVDIRTTNQASHACKMHENGKTDDEIADTLTKRHGRTFDVDHVKALRISYSRRQYSTIENSQVIDNSIETDYAIQDIFASIVKDDVDKQILEQRLLGSASIEDVAKTLDMSKKSVYERESLLKHRIKRAIEERA